MNEKKPVTDEEKEPVSDEETESAAPPETVPEDPAGEEAEETRDPEKNRKEHHREVKRLKEENASLSRSLEELTDRYTRMLAEYDNFRKRAQKERDGIYSDAVSDVLNQILPVMDSLEMAMAYADDGKLSQGVSMTLTKFTEILTKLGVEAFGAPGDPFDPNLHNAVFHTEDETLEENVVAEVLLKGYKKGDRIIRYAMVKVAN